MNEKVKKICLSAVFAALIAVVAFFVKIPLPGEYGYVHPADALICLAAVLLPGPYAFCAAAIGGGLADLISGYFIYIPFTMVIKGLLTVSFSKKEKVFSKRNIIALLLTAFITTIGYFLTELGLYGYAVAMANVPFNLAQSVVSIAIYCVLAPIVSKLNIMKLL